MTLRPPGLEHKGFALARIFDAEMTTFTARSADLGTIRFARSPVWETLQAVRLFKDPRGRPYHQAWFAAVADRARTLDLAPLLAVNPVRGMVPDFMTPPPLTPTPGIDEQLAQIRATPEAQVADELGRCLATLPAGARGPVMAMLARPAATREQLAGIISRAWAMMVEPFWPEIESFLDGDLAYRSRQLADRGLRTVIEGLDPRISWDEAGIRVADRSCTVIDLRGRGLLLMPSAFVWPAVTTAADEPWQPTIAYPARGIAGLWQRPPAPPDALIRLLGSTRAMILAGLDHPASTMALAQRHGMSPAGVSRHVTAMRDAGLLAGTRHGHEVRYARTKLGTNLARGGR
jgi:hypothetical protein